MAIRSQPRMTDEERADVRRLADVYRQMCGTRGHDEAEALAYLEDNASQELPWGEDWDRAHHLMQVADRYGGLLYARETRGG